MELPNAIYVSFTLFLFLLVLFQTIINRSKSNNTNTTNLPPGPSKLPLIGNLHQFLGSMPHHSLANLATKYGPLMHLKLGEVSNIIVSSPEMAREIMKTHDLVFSNRPHILAAVALNYNATDVAFSPYGGYWRHLRKICTMELLTTKHVQSFRPIREEEISMLVETISTREGSIVNLSKMIFSVTYGITARAAFGKKSRYQGEFISAIEEASVVAGGFYIADLYPSIGVLRSITGVKAKLEKLHRKVDMILGNIIDDHRNRKNMHHRDGAPDQEDVVDILLKFQEPKDSEYPLTDDNVKAVIMNIFSGGSETSAGVVEWAMSEMVTNPKVMEEAQAEVRKVFDNKGKVEEAELNKLTYLKAVIKETLRLHPPAPLLLPRESKESCEINGYNIPAKTRVIINAWCIGRDPRYWSDAERFKPGRFIDSPVDYRGTDFEFIPFGAGRRMCPGIAFAIADIELPLAKLLYHFDWRLPRGMMPEELDMTESFGLTVRRKNDLCLIPLRHYKP